MPPTTKVALVLLESKMNLEEVRKEDKVKMAEDVTSARRGVHGTGGNPGEGEEHGRRVVLPCLGGLPHTSLRLFSMATFLSHPCIFLVRPVALRVEKSHRKTKG